MSGENPFVLRLDKAFSAVKSAVPDEYDLKARWMPMVAALAPALLVATVSIPGFADHKFNTGTIGAAMLIALQFAGIRVVRAIGKSRQHALFKAWGGMPTTAMLRHRDERINAFTKQRLHDRLRNLGEEFHIPMEQEERDDPDGADYRYASAVDELRKRAKAKAVKAVHRENIGYGQARNLFGLKPFGLVICMASLAVLGADSLLHGDFVLTPPQIGTGLTIIVLGIVWVWGCTSDMVRCSGEAYAHTLFEAADTLIPAKRGGKPKKK